MNERFNTQDLVDLLAEKHGMNKKDADGFVKEFFLLIEQALESDRCVKIKGLGTFKLVEVDSRESVKVHTGERFQIQGHTKVSFTPDTALRDVINKPFAHFETVVLNENTVLEDTPVEEQEDESDGIVGPGDDLSLEKPVVDEEFVPDEPVEIPLSEVIEDVTEVIEVPESPVETLHTENVASQFTAEAIIANELKKAEQEFGDIRIGARDNETQPEQLPHREPIPSKQKEGKSAVPYLIAIIVCVLLLCGSALLFVYHPDLFSSGEKKEIVQTPAPQPIMQREVLLDTLVSAKDTVAEVAPKVKEAIPESPLVSAPTKVETKAPAKASIPVKPDSVSYKISGTKATHIVKEGETLTRVSLRFYGTKDLWPYIVQHNRDIIKNPDNVPYGTTLRIPELVKR